MSYFAMSASNYKVIYEAKSEIDVVEEGLLDSIGNVIRKIVEKIKDFFKYIRDKIKEIWKKLTKKKDDEKSKADEDDKTDKDGKDDEKSKDDEKTVPVEKRTVEVEITGWFDIDNGSEVESLKKLAKEAFEQELDEARYMNNQAYKHNYHNLDMEDTPREKLNQMNDKIKSVVVKKTFFGNKIDNYLKNIEKTDQIIKFLEETSVSAYDECQKIIEAGKNNPSSNKGSRDLQYIHNKLAGRTLSYVKNNALSIVKTVKKHSDIIKILKGKPDIAYFHDIKVINKNF